MTSSNFNDDYSECYGAMLCIYDKHFLFIIEVFRDFMIKNIVKNTHLFSKSA